MDEAVEMEEKNGKPSFDEDNERKKKKKKPSSVRLLYARKHFTHSIFHTSILRCSVSILAIPMTMIFCMLCKYHLHALVSGLLESVSQMNQELIVFETACSTTGEAISTQPAVMLVCIVEHVVLT